MTSEPLLQLLRKVSAAPAEGPACDGYDNDRGKMDQISSVIERLTGISHHPSHIGRLVRRHGWQMTSSTNL